MKEWRLADPLADPQVAGFGGDEAAAPKAKRARSPRPVYAKAILAFLAITGYEVVLIFSLAGNLFTGMVVFCVVFFAMFLVFALITGVAAFRGRV